MGAAASLRPLPRVRAAHFPGEYAWNGTKDAPTGLVFPERRLRQTAVPPELLLLRSSSGSSELFFFRQNRKGPRAEVIDTHAQRLSSDPRQRPSCRLRTIARSFTRGSGGSAAAGVPLKPKLKRRTSRGGRSSDPQVNELTCARDGPGRPPVAAFTAPCENNSGDCCSASTWKVKVSIT